MASTGAILYIKPQAPSTSSAGRVTGALLDFALRDSTGQFTSGGGIDSTLNLRNKRAMLPSRSVPLTDANGVIDQGWWNFFSFLNGTFLRARIGPTMLDLENAITTAQAQSVTTEAASASALQMAANNAQALQAMREVVVAAAIPNAVQIPAPQLAPQVTSTGSTGAGSSSGTGGSSGGTGGGDSGGDSGGGAD